MHYQFWYHILDSGRKARTLDCQKQAKPCKHSSEQELRHKGQRLWQCNNTYMVNFDNQLILDNRIWIKPKINHRIDLRIVNNRVTRSGDWFPGHIYQHNRQTTILLIQIQPRRHHCQALLNEILYSITILY